VSWKTAQKKDSDRIGALINTRRNAHVKVKFSPELVKFLLPIVIPIAKDLAAKTTTTVDDKIVAAVEKAAANPVLMALLFSLLADETPAPVPVEVQAEADVLTENAEVVKALFAVAKVDS
jgi:hypothetical protein